MKHKFILFSPWFLKSPVTPTLYQTRTCSVLSSKGVDDSSSFFTNNRLGLGRKSLGFDLKARGWALVYHSVSTSYEGFAYTQHDLAR